MAYDTTLLPHDPSVLLLRVLLASVAGGVIGWNRQRAGRPAGFRTHMLVSLGAALFTLVPLAISEAHAVDALSRTLQGVATGVGFLGAGEIFRERTPKTGAPLVHGLTSAAAIWVTAAIGMVAGCGLWTLTLIATVMTLAILGGGVRIEQLLIHPDDHHAGN